MLVKFGRTPTPPTLRYWTGLPAATDDGDWYTPVPKTADFPTHAYNSAAQPGTRFHYISSSGSHTFTAGPGAGGFDYYLWDGTNIVDSTGSTTGVGGVAYGTDPRNPTGPIKPCLTWAWVWQRSAGGAIGSSGLMGYNRPTAAGRNLMPDWFLFKRGDSFDISADLETYITDSGFGAGIGTQAQGCSLALSGINDTTYRQVVCAYGPTSTKRPKLYNPTRAYIYRLTAAATSVHRNTAYLDLHFDGLTRPDRVTITGTIGTGNVLTAAPTYTRYAATTYQWWRKRKAGTIAIALTLSGTSGTITATAASAIFHTSDADASNTNSQGRFIVTATGRATITGYTSTTVVTCSVQGAMAGTSIASGDWEIIDSYNNVVTSGDSRAISGETASTYTQVAADSVFDIKCSISAVDYGERDPSAYEITGYDADSVNNLMEGCLVDENARLFLLQSSGGIKLRRNVCVDTGSGNYFSGDDSTGSRELIENLFVRNGFEGPHIKTAGAGSGKCAWNILNRDLYFGGRSDAATYLYGNAFLGGASGLQFRAGGSAIGNFILANYFWIGGGDYGAVGYLDRYSSGCFSYNVMELQVQTGAGPTAEGNGIGFFHGSNKCVGSDNIIAAPYGNAIDNGYRFRYDAYAVTGSGGDVSLTANADGRYGRNIFSTPNMVDSLAEERAITTTVLATVTGTFFALDASARTITRSSGSWHASGSILNIYDGQGFFCTGWANAGNNVAFVAETVTDTVITYVARSGCVTEAAGATVTWKRCSQWITPSITRNVVRDDVIVDSSGVASKSFSNTANAGLDATFGRVPASDATSGVDIIKPRVYTTHALAAAGEGWTDTAVRTLKRYLVEITSDAVTSANGVEEYAAIISDEDTGMMRGQWNPRYAPLTGPGLWIAAGYNRGLPVDCTDVKVN